MPQWAEYLFMALGAALVVAGVLVLVFKPGTGENTMKLLGMEFTLSTPSLVVVALGCLMFAAPFLIPPQPSNAAGDSGSSSTQTDSGQSQKNITSGGRPTTGQGETSANTDASHTPHGPSDQPEDPVKTRDAVARVAKLCGLPKGTPLTLLGTKKLTTPGSKDIGYPIDTDGQQHSFFGVVLERNAKTLSLGYGYENGGGPQIQAHGPNRCTPFVPFKPSVGNARPVVQIDDWSAGDWAEVEVWEIP
jgi:hypothetical protein